MYIGWPEGQKAQAKRIIKEALTTRGWTATVDDCEEVVCTKEADFDTVVDCIGNTGMDHVTFYNGDDRLGYMTLVFGNEPDGETLISDHTMGDEICALVEAVQTRYT